MAASGYTPISLYYSTTASAVPTSGNLVAGELALNTVDEKLYFKNSAGTVKLLASNATSAPVLSFSAGTTGFTPSTATTGAVTLAGTLATTNGGTGLTSFTSGGVVYASSSSALATGSALTFNGTILSIGNSGLTGDRYVSMVNSTGNSTFGTYGGSGYGSLTSGDAYTYTGKNIVLMADDAAASIKFSSGGSAEKMRIDSAGNLGIGTNAPATKLDIRGTSNTAASTIQIIGNTVSTLLLGQNADGGVIRGQGANNVLAFWNGGTGDTGAGQSGTERARITPNGGFSVGTTADPGAGAIYATGNITAYYSDARLKTVSGKIENALDKVGKLSGVYYTNNSVAKSFGYDSDEVQVGVLAQDVEAVLPQIVKAAPFDLDADGNSKSGENYKTVQYERLVPLLIEAINELRAEVKALKGA
jgi:hypothetical protein